MLRSKTDNSNQRLHLLSNTRDHQHVAGAAVPPHVFCLFKLFIYQRNINDSVFYEGESSGNTSYCCNSLLLLLDQIFGLKYYIAALVNYYRAIILSAPHPHSNHPTDATTQQNFSNRTRLEPVDNRRANRKCSSGASPLVSSMQLSFSIAGTTW